MQTAKYIFADNSHDATEYRHYSLNVALYTHFTSPIRRYPDILVHRLLEASLSQESEFFKSPESWSQFIDQANQKKLYAKRANDQSQHLYLVHYLKRLGPVTKKALITSIDHKHYSLIVPEYGLHITKKLADFSTRTPLVLSKYENNLLYLYKNVPITKKKTISALSSSFSSSSSLTSGKSMDISIATSMSSPKLCATLRVFQKVLVQIRVILDESSSFSNILVELDSSEYTPILNSS